MWNIQECQSESEQWYRYGFTVTTTRNYLLRRAPTYDIATAGCIANHPQAERLEGAEVPLRLGNLAARRGNQVMLTTIVMKGLFRWHPEYHPLLHPKLNVVRYRILIDVCLRTIFYFILATSAARCNFRLLTSKELGATVVPAKWGRVSQSAELKSLTSRLAHA